MPLEHSPGSVRRIIHETGTDAAPSLAVLRRKRTRARRALQTEMENIRKFERVNDENRLELLTTKSRVDSRVSMLRQIEDQICNHAALREDEAEREADEADAAMEVGISAGAIIDGMLAMHVFENGAPGAKAEPSLATAATIVGSASSAPGIVNNNTNTTLFLDTTPEVFAGSAVQYKLWRSQFTNWVKRRTATGSDKLVALCKLLRGPPKELISELPLIDTNFEVALRILDSNYDVPELRQRDAIANIINVPTVRSSEDTDGLRRLLNVVQRTILSLEAADISLQNIALPYEQTIRGALPRRLLFDYEERHQQATTSTSESNPAVAAAERLEQLLAFLRRYTVLHERVGTSDSKQHRVGDGDRGDFHTTINRARHRETDRRPPRLQQSYTVAAMAKNEHRKHIGQRGNPCFFCNEAGHRPSTCPADISMRRRLDIIAQRRRCSKCFQFEHTPARRCAGPKEPCTICNSRAHYTVMHEETLPAHAGQQQQTAAGVAQTVAMAVSVRAVVMTACAFVLYGGKRLRVRCFIDSGSMVSFVTPKLIQQLSGIVPQARVDLQLQGFASEHAVTTNRYAIQLVGAYDESERVVIQAHEYNFGVDPPSNCSEEMRELIRKFGESHPLADVSLIDQRFELEPDFLIGVDQMYKIIRLNGEKAIAGGLIGRSSRFGWILSGSFGPNSTRGDIERVHTTCCAATLSKASRDLERLWTLEAIGIADPKETNLSSAELDALRQFKEGVVYDGAKYTVALPKRQSIAQLANNLNVAQTRLTAKRRSLARDSAAFDRYDREIMAFFRDGHSEEIFDIDLTTAGVRDRSFYMPHRQVITQRPEGDKWRIVFDCSAAAPGQTSLNSHLLAGPNLNPDILRLLINFRLRPVALSADNAHAYMTLGLAPDDRPYFRDLWQGLSDTLVRCFQMRKVTWGAAPSGFLLAAVLREHFGRVDPASVYDLDNCFYFDDMLRSFDTEDEAIAFIDKLVPWLKSANMSLSKWKSSSSSVVNHLCGSRVSSTASGPVESGLLKVLGIAWTPSEDSFRFQLWKIIEFSASLEIVTKRSVMRVVASIFDPVGWLIPFTVRAKILIQRLWSQTLAWEDSVSGLLLNEFLAWAGEIRELSRLRIPRLYGDSAKDVKAYHLHMFGDASEKAYAAVAYLQTLYSNGGSSCALVMSKSRIAPREKVSLPRLELMAALLAARLRVFVVERLSVKVDRVIHYTDSAVAFYWCVADEPTRWKTFVCNRVVEIQQLSSPNEWVHVPGRLNIADIATRGVAADSLISNAEWWNGPSWLADPEHSRPVTRLRARGAGADSVADELRLVVAPVIASHPLVDLERFGSWEKSVRVMANVLRFVQYCRRRPSVPESELRLLSERIIIKSTQAVHFAAEIGATLSRERPGRSSPLSSYRLLVDDDGLLRARTRLTQSLQFTFDEKHPIIIPNNSRLATLLILHCHRTNAHLGVSTVLGLLRRRFWILRGRQVIKNLLRRCVVCRRAHQHPIDQVQPPLPAERSSLTTPFATTAVDFCGPFHTSTREGTCKNYIALFTCTSIRAVHLELVPDMSALQTHLALRRFLSAQPACRLFISDNGRSFVRAAADIRRLFNSFRDPKVRELLAQHRVDWSFNCPRAPWRGGVFERLVGVTKCALNKTLGRSLISTEEFRTILCELSAVINDRPLSYTYSDLNEPQAITPSLLLRGGPLASPLCAFTSLDRLGPNGRVQAMPLEADQLRQALLERTSYFRALSIRWQREYLMQLRSANLDSSGKPRVLPNGAVCLLKEDNIPRIKWNLVRIIEGLPGRDGAIRTYSVRFANGYESRRAAQLLIPLEVPEQRGEPDVVEENNNCART